jgi:hypothetical protein
MSLVVFHVDHTMISIYRNQIFLDSIYSVLPIIWGLKHITTLIISPFQTRKEITKKILYIKFNKKKYLVICKKIIENFFFIGKFIREFFNREGFFDKFW